MEVLSVQKDSDSRLEFYLPQLKIPKLLTASALRRELGLTMMTFNSYRDVALKHCPAYKASIESRYSLEEHRDIVTKAIYARRTGKRVPAVRRDRPPFTPIEAQILTAIAWLFGEFSQKKGYPSPVKWVVSYMEEYPEFYKHVIRQSIS